jgi:penicillin-binding protein 2
MAGQAGTAVVVEVDSGHLLASYRLEVASGTLASPGSALKPFTLAALLESGKITSGTALVCRRRVRIGGQSLDCTHVETVEPLDPVAALAYSCNYFFAHQGRLLDARALAESLRRAGLTSPSRLVNEEATGAVRIAASEEEKQLEALGHSGVETTPLALLMAYRQLALKRKQSADSRALAPVFAGLEAATEYGTGQLAQPEGLRVAGKTGTARARAGAWTHAWFVGYAAADKPEIAVVVFLEHGRGGSDAAPLAREIFAAWQAQRGRR